MTAKREDLGGAVCMKNPSSVEDALQLRHLVDVEMEPTNWHLDRPVRCAAEGMDESHAFGLSSIKMTCQGRAQGEIEKESTDRRAQDQPFDTTALLLEVPSGRLT